MKTVLDLVNAQLSYIKYRMQTAYSKQQKKSVHLITIYTKEFGL